MNPCRLLCLGLGLLLAISGCGATQPTADAWNDYRERSRQWQELDQRVLHKELEDLGLKEPLSPSYADKFGFNPNKSLDWFSTREGRHLADRILSFQTPSGGWSKRTDMGTQARQPGQAFGVESQYIPTFDNGATTTQLRVLAKAHTATGKPAYANAFHKGLNLIFEAQYPNGGWPQTYPLVGGYHDQITFNDDVMVNIARLLHDILMGKREFAFVSDPLKQKASNRLDQAIQLIRETQVEVEGQPTLWAAQYDARELQPAPARAYEMVALATAESADVLDFLMELKTPSPETIASIHAGIDWFLEHKIVGYTWRSRGTQLTPDADAPPLWPRFAEIGTNRPLFGDRDGSIHHDLSELSDERRNNYAWFTHQPNQVLNTYASWRDTHPRGTDP